MYLQHAPIKRHPHKFRAQVGIAFISKRNIWISNYNGKSSLESFKLDNSRNVLTGPATYYLHTWNRENILFFEFLLSCLFLTRVLMFIYLFDQKQLILIVDGVLVVNIVFASIFIRSSRLFGMQWSGEGFVEFQVTVCDNKKRQKIFARFWISCAWYFKRWCNLKATTTFTRVRMFRKEIRKKRF